PSGVAATARLWSEAGPPQVLSQSRFPFTSNFRSTASFPLLVLTPVTYTESPAPSATPVRPSPLTVVPFQILCQTSDPIRREFHEKNSRAGVAEWIPGEAIRDAHEVGGTVGRGRHPLGYVAPVTAPGRLRQQRLRLCRCGRKGNPQ